MKILITWVGLWLDKGEAAMIIATAKALREKFPKVSISILTVPPPHEIDIIKYSEYDLKVLPGILSSFYSILPKLKFLKFKPLKAMVALPVFLALTIKNIVWLALYKGLRIDAGFLIRDNRDTVKEYRDADWFIFCGGQNIVNLNLVALYEIIFSKMLGKPVMIWANSLGPFNPKYIRPFVKWVLNKVDLITTREATSKKILEDIGVTAPVFVTADAAFTLPPIPQKEAMMIVEQETKIPKNKLMVGVTVIPWSFPGERGDVDKKFENYLKAVAGAADYIIEKLNAHVLFFPQVILPTKDDRPISIEVFNKIKNKSKATVLTADYTPEQIKGMYGCMSLLIGTRFHSCILAQSMHVPTIAIEYDGHKALGIMRLLDLEEYVCDINTITTPELTSKIDKIWAEKDEVKKNLEKNIRIMQAKSMDNVRLAVEYLGLQESP
ncbi:MAG: polysaccharide pyruvyl transferase family protein [Halobacteriota archaeon]